MKKFKYIIPLGHFCSPAMEFERINRRKHSFPFDWLITPDIQIILELIENNFQDFLNADYLYQLKQHPKYYRNTKWNIDFYHDFSAFKSFDSQIDDVTQKYNRRIARFYQVIKEPTLFCRYITEKDLPYIYENYQHILNVLQKFNPQNEIIFVANDDLTLSETNIPFYSVEKDANDTVSRAFLEKNSALKSFILDNVEEASCKTDSKTNKCYRFLNKTYQKIRLKLKLVYHHNKQI